ncbi:hypothetical protein Leryth_015017 [Lithospermum erythrorhizon]|nr:hypothetical protein Leryth_015017 [Lithospermum erythrorhizon]
MMKAIVMFIYKVIKLSLHYQLTSNKRRKKYQMQASGPSIEI